MTHRIDRAELLRMTQRLKDIRTAYSDPRSGGLEAMTVKRWLDESYECPVPVVAASDYDALAAELAECRADAERYRWLRDRIEVRRQEAMSGSVRPALSVRIGSAFLDSPCSRLKSLNDPDAHETRSRELDAAIDAARAADSAEVKP
jgi:hypothetical protein